MLLQIVDTCLGTNRKTLGVKINRFDDAWLNRFDIRLTMGIILVIGHFFHPSLSVLISLLVATKLCEFTKIKLRLSNWCNNCNLSNLGV